MKVNKKNKKVDSKLSKKQIEVALKKKLKEQGINEEWMKHHLLIDFL